MHPFAPFGAFAPLGCVALAGELTWPKFLLLNSEPLLSIVEFGPIVLLATLQSSWVSSSGDWPDTRDR